MRLRSVLMIALAGMASLTVSGAAFGQLPMRPPPIVNWIGCGNVEPGLGRILAHGSGRAIDIVVSSRLANNGRGDGGEAIDWTIQVNADPSGPNTWNIVCRKTSDENDGGTFRIIAPNGFVLVENPIDELDPADLLL